MTADNFDNTLTAFRQRSPYRPFLVVLPSGTRFEVDHPGALVPRDEVAVFVGRSAARHSHTTQEEPRTRDDNSPRCA